MNPDFAGAARRLKDVIIKTPLQLNQNLSKKYGCKVYLKREDLQVVRSYKIRGAYNKMSSLTLEALERGVVCASAGNHAQGVAFSAMKLDATAHIFMPVTTPDQKLRQTKMFGGDRIRIKLTGDCYDDCCRAAKDFAEEHAMQFIPPFDDARIIEGQGTIGAELLQDLATIDYVFIPVGGGGLAAGLGSYLKQYSTGTKIIGAEPEGAASMQAAFETGRPVELAETEPFVDGASVKRVGDLTFSICKEVIDAMVIVPEGKICSAILKLYDEDAIVAEPAGALSVAALEDYAEEIRGKEVVCILSGGNNDIDRMQEIKERSLLYEGLKHYFLIPFSQRPGALKEFVNDVLGPNDDIVRFEYMKKNNREKGLTMVGIEVKNRNDYSKLIGRMQANNFNYKELRREEELWRYVV